ncbi:MAG: hypothetical protein ACREQB_00030 [Candidatus Binataceae bacterium]
MSVRGKRRDLVEPAIVNALEDIGAIVWRLHVPADLLVSFRRKWYVLECKTRDKLRGDQKAQRAFLELTETPVVRTAEDALRAVGAIR